MSLPQKKLESSTTAGAESVENRLRRIGAATAVQFGMMVTPALSSGKQFWFNNILQFPTDSSMEARRYSISIRSVRKGPQPALSTENSTCSESSRNEQYPSLLRLYSFPICSTIFA